MPTRYMWEIYRAGEDAFKWVKEMYSREVSMHRLYNGMYQWKGL